MADPLFGTEGCLEPDQDWPPEQNFASLFVKLREKGQTESLEHHFLVL